MNDGRNRKRQRIRSVVAGVALIALIATSFVVWPRGPKEPVFQGKALTQWINDAHDVGVFEQTDETKAAMQAFGTNAVPFLLNEFTRPISNWRERLYAAVNAYTPIKLRLRAGDESVRVAGRGLMLLETNAAPALPVLVRYLDDPIRGAFVKDILFGVSDAAVRYLTAEFASTNAAAITNALVILRRMARHSAPAREALTAALTHPSPTVRAAAAGAGSQLMKNPAEER